MAMDILFPRKLWDDLFNYMLGSRALAHRDETLAYILTSPRRSGSAHAMLVHEMVCLEAHDYESRGPGAVAPQAAFVASLLTECRQNGFGLLEVHTHPFDTSNQTSFSGIDWNNDEAKFPALRSVMGPDFQHATMVMGQKSFDAHYYDDSGEILPVSRVRLVGGSNTDKVVADYLPTSYPRIVDDGTAIPVEFDRHGRFIGEEGVRRLARLKVAVVGVGGLGSILSIELAYLGVGELVLVDPDKLEDTNLNRVLGAGLDDIGSYKADVLASHLKAHGSGITRTTAINDGVGAAVGEICDADIVFGCVDNDGARLLLNQLALQYLIPLVDAGSGIDVRRRRYGGQVQIVAPGRGCLLCRGYINASRAAYDLASTSEQEYESSHGYGVTEKAPSVVTLNGVIASAQANILLNVYGLQTPVDDLVIYDGGSMSMRGVSAPGNTHCAVCGSDGIVGIGDLLDTEENRVRSDSVPSSFSSSAVPSGEVHLA